MINVVAALIIYRNRYLISKIPDGEFADKWEFPGGPVSADTAGFEAIKNAVKERLGIDVFPYLTAKRLLYKSRNEDVAITLIKCSISDETKRSLSVNIPSRYKWIHLVYAADINFTDRDKVIFNYLTDGLSVMPPKRRAPRSASIGTTGAGSIAAADSNGAAARAG